MGRPDGGPGRRQVALAGFGGDTGLVRQALSSPSPEVRASALSALSRLGELGTRELELALSDSSPAVRARACALATQLGPLPVEELVTGALGDREPAVVEAAAYALGERGGVGPATVEALARVARDHPDPLCREAAVAAMGALGAQRGLPTVLAALADKPAVRRRAVVALAAYEGPEVDQALERAATDPDWQVRQAAEDLLGRPG